MARNTACRRRERDAPPITAHARRASSPTHPSRGWSDAVEREAHRTFYNWLGCAIGAASHEAAEAALAAVAMLEPAPQASVLGRAERVDMASAALVNGITSHTFDFDDTHLKTIIHPAGPVASAVLALAEQRGACGPRRDRRAGARHRRRLPRSATSMYPDHYDRGWHITGSTGMLGAAAGCARLLGLDAPQTTMALGIAASQPIGLREQFGTMTKPFHPGAAARAGLMSALLAQPRLHGERARARSAARLRPGGLRQARLARGHRRARRALRDLVQHLQAVRLRHRHPSEHRRLRAAEGARHRAAAVARIELRVHPLVLELTGKKEPRDGLEGKFSVYHGCAAGPHLRPRRRGRVRRRRRQPRRRGRPTPQGAGDRRRVDRRGRAPTSRRC